MGATTYRWADSPRARGHVTGEDPVFNRRAAHLVLMERAENQARPAIASISSSTAAASVAQEHTKRTDPSSN